MEIINDCIDVGSRWLDCQHQQVKVPRELNLDADINHQSFCWVSCSVHNEGDIGRGLKEEFQVLTSHFAWILHYTKTCVKVEMFRESCGVVVV